MNVEPRKEHQWLEQLVGEWTYESEAVMGPDQPPVKMTGSEVVRSLGSVWVMCEGRGECPGHGMGFTILSLGFDPAKKRFVGTFIGSMMTNLWVYDGQLDAAGKVLTLDAEGPNFTGDGTMTKYKDAVEIKSPNHRVLRSSYLTPDGKWQTFMTSNYKRVK